MSQPAVVVAPPLSLAHPSTDPATLVARLRAALGWRGSDFLVGLQGYDELSATLETAHDIDGLFRVGDPLSPHVRLLRALNSSATGLRVTRVAQVPAPWRWARLGEGNAEIAGVALRQQAYADVVSLLGRAGVTFRVFPDDTTTAALLDAARPLGSAVLDVDEVPDDASLVPGWLETAPDLVYGLVSREEPVAHDVVWLAIAPETEAAGTLMVALERFSNRGFDLTFLHSDPRPDGIHDFFLGFAMGDAGSGGTDPADGERRLVELQQRLLDVGFANRVLAAFGRPPT